MRNIHKTIINRLRKFDRMESLWVLWAYYHNAQYNKPFPNDITPHPNYIKNKVHTLTISKAIIALREIICYAGYRATPIKKGLMHPYNFGLFWDGISEINNAIYTYNTSIDEYEKANLELFKLSHQQFKWQFINSNQMYYHNIYYFLFTDSEISSMVRNKIGLTPLEIYGIGWILISEFRDKFAIQKDISIDGTFQNFSSEKLQIFLEIFSENIDTLASEIIKQINYDNGFEFYGIKELLNSPLIKISKLGKIYYSSPISDLLLRSVGESLYFKLIREGDFQRLYGNRFQSLCLKNINKYLQDDTKIFFGIDEDLVRNDGKKIKVNTDFYIHDSNSLIFMDAKTKMIPESAYIKSDSSVIQIELDKWVKDILMQSYETIVRYNNGDFNHCTPPSYQNIFPVILTLNDLYLGLGIPGYTSYEILDNMLRVQLSEKGISADYLDKYPYIFISIHELPIFLMALKTYGIDNILNAYKDQKYKHYGIRDLISKLYPEMKQEETVMTDTYLDEEIVHHFIRK